jgi:hypothetical protein
VLAGCDAGVQWVSVDDTRNPSTGGRVKGELAHPNTVEIPVKCDIVILGGLRAEPETENFRSRPRQWSYDPSHCDETAHSTPTERET